MRNSAIYYSIADPYPPYRSDLVELFGVELEDLGLSTVWFMARQTKESTEATVIQRSNVHLPWNVPRLMHPLRKFMYWMSDLVFMIAKTGKNVVAIQCRDKYVASLMGLILSKIKRKPFFYWCSYPFPEHDALTAEERHGVKRLLGKLKAYFRFALLYKWICLRADHVFVQSERMKFDMQSYGVPAEKMTPVPMGVSERVFDWAKNHQTDVVPGRVVYLGTLAAVRKLDMLLEAFQAVKKEVPHAQLMFVGDGDVPSERQALVDKAIAMGLERDVVFTGFVPMQEAWRLSASAAVCLSPMYPTKILLSASPTKLVEYLALGRPVVCNDHPEQSQIIQQCGAGLCVEWSSAAFSGAILQLLRDPATAEKMAANGPVWVANNRTYPIIAKAVWSRYQSLLGKSR